MTRTHVTLKPHFSHAAVIEGTVRKAFPDAWHGLYYFDPARGRGPWEEASIVGSLVLRNHDPSHRRYVQDFENEVARAIKAGNGKIVPCYAARKKAAYLMGAVVPKTARERLEEFFGPEVVARQTDLKKFARLYQEFIVRHELKHAIEWLDPYARPEPEFYTVKDSEKRADGYSLLGMFRKYGAPIFDFAADVRDGRIWQDHKDYPTAKTIENVILHSREHGTQSLTRLDDRDLYHLSHKLSGCTRALRV